MDSDPDLRRKLAKEARLWGLAVLCAAVGAGTVAATDAVPAGVVAFLVAVAALGPLLYLYERRQPR